MPIKIRREIEIRELIIKLSTDYREEGCFSPLSRKEVKIIDSLWGNLRKNLDSPFSRYFLKVVRSKFFWHTIKVLEVLKLINPQSIYLSSIENWCSKYEAEKKYLGDNPVVRDETERLNLIRHHSLGRLTVSVVDPILHTLLYNLNFFRKNLKAKKIIAEGIMENIFFPDYVDDPATLAWVLDEWASERDAFLYATSSLKKKSNKSPPSFNKILEITLSKVSPNSTQKTASVEPKLPAAFDITPEIYGTPRSTSYMFINLSKLIKKGIKGSNLREKHEQLLNWLDDRYNQKCFESNPYLKALLLECFYHAETFEETDDSKSKDLEKIFQKICIDAEKEVNENQKLRLGRIGRFIYEEIKDIGVKIGVELSKPPGSL